LWSGSLSFGLVNVPVQLLSSVRDQGVHFTQIHEKDGAPIDTRRFCSKEDKEVPYEEIVAGYEVKKGKWVMLTDEDFEAVEPRRTRTIDIEAFVPAEEVDPIYFDHPYWVVPTGGGEGAARAYRLLVKVMKDSDRLALIEELTTDFKPSRYKDRHRERLLKVIDQKKKGKTIKPPPERDEEPEPLPDLMKALEASLASAKEKGRSRAKARS
jgi:DNA end-binding protein Ku